MFKKKLFPLHLFLTFFISAVGQTSEHYGYGMDNTRDSLSYARIRQHMDSIRAERPTVALVLSGGGAKGAAHISIIQYLENQHIPIDLVMGTSIGGLVGGLYACGYNGKQLEAIIRSMDWDWLLLDLNPRSYDAMSEKDYDRCFQLSIPYGTYKARLDIQNPGKEIRRRGLLQDGIVQGRNIEDLFACLLAGYEDEIDFLSLPTPFVCVATDLVTAKPKVWMNGSLITALRSTMSIPGLFSPVKNNGMVLMDGSMRSNFPAEIAKELGADIIIGVDISSPALEFHQINSLTDMVFQTFDVLGREAYSSALKVTDIYIQPDLTGFNLLSFDSQSIATIIERGRQSAEQHKEDFEELNKLFEGENPYLFPRYPRFKKAVDLRSTNIDLRKIEFVGIDSKEERFLRRKLNMRSSDRRSLHTIDIENAISIMMGTKAFEKVTYEILGDTVPYVLRFNCFRAPVNRLGASVRFDAVDFASILLNTGLNAHKLTGARFDLTARLGLNTKVSSGLSLRSGRGVDLNLDLSFQAVRNGAFRIEPYDIRIDFNRGEADAHISLTPWKTVDLRLGGHADYFYRTSMLYDYELTAYNLDHMNKSNIFVGPYVSLRSDSFDDAYFPVSGWQTRVSYRWLISGLLHETERLHAVEIRLRHAKSSRHLTYIPFIQARHVSCIIAPYVNMLAVDDANKVLEQQITFAGINAPVLSMRTVATGGLNIRRQFGKKHYLTLTAQLLHESQELTDFVDSKLSETYYGFALEYAYNSFVGPIRANVHWSDIQKRLGFYVGIGFDF